MQPSTEVRDTVLRFYDRISAKDVASFDRLVSRNEHTLVIGTAPGEWVTDRPRLRYGFEAEGMTLTAGPNPRGWERGDVGWAVDEPTYHFPDQSSMRCRLTALVQREDGDWRIVHMHWSVGVPDDEVADLQARDRKSVV